MMRARTSTLFVLVALLTGLLFCLDLTVGSVGIPLGEVLSALTGGDCAPATAKSF